MTRADQYAAAAVIHGWPKHERLAVAQLPAKERDLIMLAAALLDVAPGMPETRDVIELP